MVLAGARLSVGVACVVFAVVLAVVHVPDTIRSMNGTVRGYGYLHTQQDRVITSGDIQGLPFQLQLEALALIPPRSEYAVLLPDTPQAAESYGINSITYQTARPFLRYLLLPSWPSTPQEARYIICFGCNTDPWDRRTSWLWRDDKGDSIGKVRGR